MLGIVINLGVSKEEEETPNTLSHGIVTSFLTNSAVILCIRFLSSISTFLIAIAWLY